MGLFQRVIATFLFGAYALTGTAVIPALASLLAHLDGGHSVIVNLSEAGFHLSLCHQSGNLTPEPADHHSAAGRLVTRFCRHSSNGSHELNSGQVSAFISPDRDLKKNVDQAPLPSLNHGASLILSIVTDRPSETMSSLGRSQATSRQPLPSSLRPMMATIQLLV